MEPPPSPASPRLAASLSPLLELSDFTNVDQFLQKYYKEMTPADMAKVLKRIEGEVEHQQPASARMCAITSRWTASNLFIA